VFGDNQSVLINSELPHSTLQKRHQALCFHRVREAVAAKIVGFYKIDGTNNPADMLSKHWAVHQVWTVLRPLLFCRGETYPPDKPECDKGEYQDLNAPSIVSDSKSLVRDSVTNDRKSFAPHVTGVSEIQDLEAKKIQHGNLGGSESAVKNTGSLSSWKTKIKQD